MKKNVFSLIAIVGLMAITSCKTPENVAYFQDLSTGSVVQAAQVLEVKVKPEDKLSIVVTTQDPSLSALFNLVTIQNRAEVAGSTRGYTNTGGQVSYYTVDSEGNIDFPVVGKIHIAGLTREEVAEKIVEELVKRNLVKNPIVTVEFANQCVVVLGEVKTPGKYNFNEDHITILEALAMAGDLTINGMRDNVLVMRKTSEGMQKAYRVDLTHAADLASSPVYYLQQDDVVYIEPDDKKKRETTPNGNTPYTPSFWVSMGSFGLTIATLVITLTK